MIAKLKTSCPAESLLLLEISIIDMVDPVSPSAKNNDDDGSGINAD